MTSEEEDRIIDTIISSDDEEEQVSKPQTCKRKHSDANNDDPELNAALLSSAIAQVEYLECENKRLKNDRERQEHIELKHIVKNVNLTNEKKDREESFRREKKRWMDEKRRLEETLRHLNKRLEEERGSLEHRHVSELEAKMRSLQEDLDREKKHLKEAQEQRECKICFDAECSLLFRPCNHVSTCEECSMTLSQCPICRQIIYEKIKAFM